MLIPPRTHVGVCFLIYLWRFVLLRETPDSNKTLLASSKALRAAPRSTFRSISHSKLNSLSLGSDLLERPEDENSPEFKEYLKALLTLQANRAKTGHSAPSSGSSDAYFAKLTRIKVERNLRRDAGLPDDDIDTSYKEIDYRNAMYESSEPMISSDGGSGKKSRGMSKEEAALQREVEERVMAMVHNRVNGDEPAAGTGTTSLDNSNKALTSPVSAAPSQAKAYKDITAKIKLSGTEEALINNVLSGKARPAAPRVQKPVIREETPAPAPAQSSLSVEEQNAQETRRAAEAADAKRAAFKAAIQKAETKETAQTQSKAASSSDFSAAVESAKKNLAQAAAQPAAVQTAVTTPGKKLTLDELDTAAKALQLLVRHRGGGPFGPGRLQGPEAEELAAALRRAETMLLRDAAEDAPHIQSSAPPAATLAPPVAVAPVVKTVAAPVVNAVAALVTSPPVTARAIPVKTAPLPVSTPAPPAAAAAQQAGEPRVVTIAEGLDAFLLAPQSVSRADLEGLRDGIIHCLGLIQAQISARPPAAAAAVEAAPEPARNKAPPRLSEGESMDQQIRTAMGLLLKHRGGPSFGHGRLQGEELSVLEERLQAVAGALLTEALEADDAAKRITLESSKAT